MSKVKREAWSNCRNSPRCSTTSWSCLNCDLSHPGIAIRQFYIDHKTSWSCRPLEEVLLISIVYQILSIVYNNNFESSSHRISCCCYMQQNEPQATLFHRCMSTRILYEQLTWCIASTLVAHKQLPPLIEKDEIHATRWIDSLAYNAHQIETGKRYCTRLRLLTVGLAGWAGMAFWWKRRKRDVLSPYSLSFHIPARKRSPANHYHWNSTQ